LINFRGNYRKPTLTFKYIKEKHKERYVHRPRVEIRLSNGNNSIKLAMLVDSGADISLIPLEIAEILKLKLTDKRISNSASGSFETAYSEVYAELLKGSRSYKLGKISVLIPIKKKDNSNDTAPHILLGRSHFFKQFDITFRESVFKIVLRNPKKS
jgi:hypothetical protein